MVGVICINAEKCVLELSCCSFLAWTPVASYLAVLAEISAELAQPLSLMYADSF